MTNVYALKPKFADDAGYREWVSSWQTIYGYLSDGIRAKKIQLKDMQRSGDERGASMHKNLTLMRADARKMMTILEEAKLRRDRIREMKKQMHEQLESYPITFNTRVADFHFNKVTLEFPWMPKWVLKANGKSFYIEHLSAAIGFDTRELESGSTLGMLRFRKCEITIDRDNVAHLSNQSAVALVA